MALLTLEISLDILLRAIASWNRHDRLQLWQFLSEDLFGSPADALDRSPAEDLRQSLQEATSGQTLPIEVMWLAVESAPESVNAD